MGRRLMLMVGGVALGLLLTSCELDPSLFRTFAVTTSDDVVDAVPGDGVCDDGAGRCSLRGAIQEGNALGGLTTVELTAGQTYHLTIAGSDEDDGATGDLDVHKAIGLTGNGATVDAQQLDRVLDVHDGGALITSQLTITGGEVLSSTDGDPRGGGVRSLGALLLLGSEVSGNRVVDDVGGAEPPIEEISGGGGVQATSVTVIDSTVSGNEVGDPTSVPPGLAGVGGGIWATVSANVTDSTIEANLVTGSTAGGGGVVVEDFVEDYDQVLPPNTLVMAGSTVSNNHIEVGEGAAGGGGVWADEASITGSDISDNTLSDTSFGIGGGILAGGDLDLTDSTVRGNRAMCGAGVLAYWGFDNSTGHLTVTRSTVSSNTAVSRAAGLAFLSGPSSTGSAIVRDSAIVGNEAQDGSGGGVYVSLTPSFEISTSTISGNVARVSPPNSWTGSGGGIFAADSTLSLSSVTVTGNTAESEGGGIWTEDSTLTFENTVIGDQVGGDDCADSFFASTVISLGHNLDSDGTCGLGDTTDQSGVSPLLGPLGDNGGPTPSHLPLPGSPLIDHIVPGMNGCGSFADQRGQPRPQGAGCDIGSVET